MVVILTAVACSVSALVSIAVALQEKGRPSRGYQEVVVPRFTETPVIDNRPLTITLQETLIASHSHVHVDLGISRAIEKHMKLFYAAVMCDSGLINRYAYLWYRDVLFMQSEDEFRRDLTLRLQASNHLTPRTTVRSVFRSTTFLHASPPKNHTHPTAAAERNAMCVFFQSVAIGCGRELFMKQSSAADQRKKVKGSRAYYWMKDVTSFPQDDQVPINALIGLVDVDYYMDMPRFLAQNTHPVIIYTIQPSNPAGQMPNTIFWFEDNLIRTSVAGGSQFKHPIWDYGHDNIRCTYQIRPGMDGLISTSYLVERRNVSVHRQIILLTPIGQWTGFQAALSENLSAHELIPLQPLAGKFNVIRSQRGDEGVVSISQEGGQASATIPLMVHETLVAAAQSCNFKLQGATIQSYLTSPSAKHDAQLLRPYFNSYVPSRTFVYYVDHPIAHYEFYSGTNHQDSLKVSLHAFMNPLLGQLPCAPVRSKNNDERCVKARVTDIQHKKPLRVDAFLVHVIREFVELLVPEPWQCVPYGVEEVYLKQNRPTQRQQLDEAQLEGPVVDRRVNCFQKAEAYGKLTDPRNISTIASIDKLEYSQFCYAFAQHMKSVPWYAFGKTPKEWSQKVADAMGHSRGACMGDFSRMDGHVSNIGRTLTRAFSMRCTNPVYHEKLSDLLNTQQFRKARTAFGVKFNTLWTRLSGSPETSLFNTIENAFICFLALRMTRHSDGHYFTPAEAWDYLCEKCLFGGDDSLMGDMTEAMYTRAAQKVGHVATAAVLQRGEPGVNFLARYFGPNVWQGDPTNMCDIERQARKFHTCTQPMPDYEARMAKMTEKCLSLAMTDLSTPFLGQIARAWLHRRKVKIPDSILPCRDASWWAVSFDATDQFPNDYADWMLEYVHTALPELSMETFNEWIQSFETEEISCEDFLNGPTFSPHHPNAPAKADVVVNGDILRSESAVEESPSLERKDEPEEEKEFHHCVKLMDGTPVTDKENPPPQESKEPHVPLDKRTLAPTTSKAEPRTRSKAKPSVGADPPASKSNAESSRAPSLNVKDGAEEAGVKKPDAVVSTPKPDTPARAKSGKGAHRGKRGRRKKRGPRGASAPKSDA